MRIFIAINFGDEIKSKILSVQQELRKSFPNRARWEDKNKFHITLMFLGDVDKSKLNDIILALENISIGSNMINLESGNVDAFPDMHRARVLFLEINNPDNQLKYLYQRISESLLPLGFSTDKEFHSHITLCRVKDVKRLSEIGIFRNIKGDFRCSVNSFQLMESKLQPGGSVYKTIKTFALK